MPTVEYSTYTKKSTILALAQRDPSFAEFYMQYQDQIVQPAPLPIDFWDDVIVIAEKEPALSSAVKRCRENAQAAQAFAIPGLLELAELCKSRPLVYHDDKTLSEIKSESVLVFPVCVTSSR